MKEKAREEIRKMRDYYERENFKKCPICRKAIDYHCDGFYCDEKLNVWICRDHKLRDILKVVKLRDKRLIKFIKEQEK